MSPIRVVSCGDRINLVALIQICSSPSLSDEVEELQAASSRSTHASGTDEPVRPTLTQHSEEFGCMAGTKLILSDYDPSVTVEVRDCRAFPGERRDADPWSRRRRNMEDTMARIAKSARQTAETISDAATTAAEAVVIARKAIKTAKKAGSQAKGVATQVVDRVTGREAARRRKGMAIAGGVAAAAVVAGVAASRMRKGRKH
jgi:hypothetical protein